MSSLIESAARGVRETLPGIGANKETTVKQTARGQDLIKQLATGGLALGGGVGAAVVLLNYLKSMQQEAEVDDESRLNDDTLYIPSGRTKMASDVNRWLAPGVAVTGGILSAGGAYALTQAVYNYLQKKHRQKLLDEAQNDTLLAADIETQKSAAQMTFSDLVTAFPVAVPLLAALASGGVAYAALNKTFPVVQTPKSKYPKRVRQVAADGDVEPLDPSLNVKSASDRYAEEDCEAAAMEFMTMFTDSVAMEKGAFCITSDIINRVASDGVDGLTRVLRDQGLPAMVEIVKGASEHPVDDHTKAAAAAVIFKSARLAPVVGAVAAAELLDMIPGVMSMCQDMDHDQLDKLAGVGSLMQMSWIRPGIEKAAAALPVDNPLMSALVAALSGRNQTQTEGELPSGELTGTAADEDRDAAMTSDVSGSMAEDNEGSSEGDVDDESQDDDDAVDAFMDNPTAAPPPRA